MWYKMLQLISHTPLYVWFLLAIFLQKGWKARKTSVVSWKNLLIMPVVMTTWSIYSLVTHYEPISLCFWVMSLTAGVWLGSFTTRNLGLRFDKKRHLIEITGSWIPMILSLSIFSLRYFLGATYGLHPELLGDPILLTIENMASVISGMFIGRLMGYWKRFKVSSHTDLSGVRV